MIKLLKDNDLNYNIINNVDQILDQDDIYNFYKDSKDNGRILLTFSTHKSLSNLVSISTYNDISFKIGIHDEAHTMPAKTRKTSSAVEIALCRLINDNVIEKNYYFTATPIEDGDLGNNKWIYGDIIYELTNREAIKDVLITQPILNVFPINKDLKSFNVTDYVNVLNEVYKNEIKSTKEDRFINLVTLKSKDEMYAILNSKEWIKFCELNDIFYIGTTSYKKYNYVKGKDLDRVRNPILYVDDFIKNIHINTDKNCFIFHIDKLTMGIDVPGISGVTLFKNSRGFNLSQTIGRSLRLNQTDRINLSKVNYEDRRFYSKHKLLKNKSNIYMLMSMDKSIGDFYQLYN